MVICQLHETGWRLSVSNMRRNDGFLSATSGRIMRKVGGYMLVS